MKTAEFLKNFAVGIVALGLAALLLVLGIVMWPLVIVAGSVFLLGLKLVLSVAILIVFIAAIGYLVRKMLGAKD